LAVLGEEASVQGYGLAGAVVLVAEDADAVRAAWDGLAEDVAVVILTPAAARALGGELRPELPLTVVMPS
jgi:vacuolar-type H+-ATPase subunit F/Vma7